MSHISHASRGLRFTFNSLRQVIDALTKVLVGLYEEPEKPGNALEFIQQHMTSTAANTGDIETLRQENAELKASNEKLTARVAELEAAAGGGGDE